MHKLVSKESVINVLRMLLCSEQVLITAGCIFVEFFTSLITVFFCFRSITEEERERLDILAQFYRFCFVSYLLSLVI